MKEKNSKRSKGNSDYQKIKIDSKQSQEIIQVLYKKSNTPVFIINGTGNYIEANKTALKFLECSKQDLVGKNIIDFTPPDVDKNKVIKIHQKLWKRGGQTETVYNVNGKTKILELTVTPGFWKEQPVIWGVGIDITKRKESEEKITHLNRVLLAIRNVNQLIIKEKNRETLIQKACNILVETRGYYDAWIALLDEKQKYLTSAEAGHGHLVFSPMVDQLRKGNWPNCLATVLKQKKMMAVDDSKKICQDCPLFAYHKSRSAYNIALRHNESVYGILSVCIPKKYIKDKEEQSLFKEVAGDLSFTLYNMEIEEKRKQSEELLQEKTDKLTMLLEISNTLAAFHETKNLFQKIVDSSVRLGEMGSAAIYTLKDNLLYLEATHPALPVDFPEEFRRATLSDHPHIKKAIITRHPVVLPDTQSVKLSPEEEAVSKSRNLRSLLYLPLFYKDRSIGVLIVGSVGKLYHFSNEEIDIYYTLASQISLTIEETRMFEENQEITKELQKSEARFRNIMASMQDIVFTLDKAQRYTGIYGPWVKNWGLTPEHFLGKTNREILGENNAKVHEEANKKALKGQYTVYEWSAENDKGEIYFQTSLSPIFDEKGEVQGLVGVGRHITELRQSQQKLQKALDATIDLMSKVVEIRDPYTSGHQERVSQLSTRIAQELNLSLEEIESIRIASLIHDIGKIGIPSEILNKPTKLTDIEFNLIKSHPQTGYDIVKKINFPYPLAEIILQHHEKLNGSGYPNQLKGPEIKLEAKILCVADAVEAMSSYRPYRAALGIDAALEEITKNKGILYDTEIADACVKLFKEKGFRFE
jgi:PAS domain S-box-containing protein/putative nucleotidyltransferase with HDIG domain